MNTNFTRIFKPNETCHVCGNKLIRNIVKQTEVCTNTRCPVREIIFNIFAVAEET